MTSEELKAKYTKESWGKLMESLNLAYCACESLRTMHPNSQDLIAHESLALDAREWSLLHAHHPGRIDDGEEVAALWRGARETASWWPFPDEDKHPN